MDPYPNTNTSGHASIQHPRPGTVTDRFKLYMETKYPLQMRRQVVQSYKSVRTGRYYSSR